MPSISSRTRASGEAAETAPRRRAADGGVGRARDAVALLNREAERLAADRPEGPRRTATPSPPRHRAQALPPISGARHKPRTAQAKGRKSFGQVQGARARVVPRGGRQPPRAPPPPSGQPLVTRARSSRRSSPCPRKEHGHVGRDVSSTGRGRASRTTRRRLLGRRPRRRRRP